jgi:hypothetical protein
MNISKITGIIEDHKRDNSGRIKVISFRRNGEIVNAAHEIKELFPPEGYVFAPKFFDRFDFKLHSLIEFSINTILPRNQRGDSVLMDIDRECKSVGYKVFKIATSILTDDLAINHSVLKSHIEGDVSNFYVANHNNLYGPFKSANGDITPKIGKEVGKFDLKGNQLITSEQSCYLIEQPTDPIEKIDCMNQLQLTEWFKDQIRNLKLNIDSAAIKKVFDSQDFNGLDSVRLKRSMKILEHLSLKNSELRLLADSSTSLSSQYLKAVEKVRSEIVSEHIEPVELEKELIKKKIHTLKETLGLYEDKRGKLLADISTLKKEYDFLTNAKERLIQDIKVHSLVKSSESKPDKKVTYEIQEFNHIGANFSTISEFIQVFNDTIEGDEVSQNIGGQYLYKFEEYKGFLVNEIRILLQIAKVSNNCKVLLQQVEPDWLKFDALLSNGLQTIWSQAIEQPEKLHFLVLQDLNMASIECYGRPLLDVMLGIRKTIPGQTSEYPKNLWVFGIPLKEMVDGEFGLPLIKTSYEGWGFFPKVKSDIRFKKTKEGKKLRIDDLFNHGILTSNSPTEYF